jgi:hypothetical protein
MDRRNNCDYSPTLREQPGAGRIVFDKVPHSPAGVITGGVFCDASSASQLGLCQVVRGEQIVISAICWIDALRCLDPLTETVDKRSNRSTARFSRRRGRRLPSAQLDFETIA